MARKGKASPAPPLPPWKRRLFTALAVGLPLLVFLAAELVLRSFGWGGYPPFLREVGKLPSGETLCLVEPAASKPYFFANPDRPGYAEQSSFVMPKPAGTVRIFLVGESAAKGYPQPRNLSMASFLRAMLSDLHPDKKIEVIDLGTTAVASFPLVYMVRDALRFDPDLFIFYTGNNEFFGAYGTASINAAGSLPPWGLRAMRAFRGLALVQALDSLLQAAKTDENRTLMEEMIGRSAIPPDSPLRAAAARNLSTNLGTMLDNVKYAGVAALVCTTAGNEAGLAPLGQDEWNAVDAYTRREVERQMEEGANALARGEPSAAIAPLRAAVKSVPRHARSHFLLGRALAATGDREGARTAFLAARDLDTMPWRPVSETENAIRSAAESRGVPLCDIAEEFRASSPEGAAGWSHLDDHVHLTLAGQAAAARAMVRRLSASPGLLAADPARVGGLPPDEDYAKRLGSNFYDDYRVNHTLRVLFGVPFMKSSNPEAFERFERAAGGAEERMSPAMFRVAREWQTSKPHAGGLRPITGMAARVLLRENRVGEALPLYEIAATQVPTFTSWYLEYVYFALACRERIHGTLDDRDLARAADAIMQGRFLLEHGFSGTGLTERYIGRLHQLRGEWEESIPFLLAARSLLSAEDLVACDQALFLSYLKTGRKSEAVELVETGIRDSGRFAPHYRRMKQEIP